MRMFHNQKIKVKTIIKDGTWQYMIDYARIKKPEEFLATFFQCYTDGKSSLMVIDTDIFYERSQEDVESIIVKIKNGFDAKGIKYREIVTKKDSDTKIFGIKINSSEKVNNYRIGVAVEQEQIGEITGIVHNYNLFSYVMKDMLAKVLIERFEDVRGEYEELIDICEYHFYHDSFSHRIKIDSKRELNHLIEMIFQKYEQ